MSLLLPKCSLQGCTNACFYDTTSCKLFEFCCQDHLQQAQKFAPMPTKIQCKLPNCSQPVFHNSDFCSISHKNEYEKSQQGFVAKTWSAVVQATGWQPMCKHCKKHPAQSGFDFCSKEHGKKYKSKPKK